MKSALDTGTDIGTGPAIVLLHGFPHTHRLWDAVVPEVAAAHRVVTVDLVAGGSALEMAERLVGLFDRLGLPEATVVAIDAGVAPAVGLALTHPARVAALVVIEAVLPGLPGAERFLQMPPWWFGFHQVPDLPETVIEGHERDYIEWFLRLGTASGLGVSPELTGAFVAAYSGRTALAGAFEHYRAMPRSADELHDVTRRSRLTMPVLAIGARPVGPVLAEQLARITDDLSRVQLEDCGHLVPIDAPERLLDALRDWSAALERRRSQ